MLSNSREVDTSYGCSERCSQSDYSVTDEYIICYHFTPHLVAAIADQPFYASLPTENDVMLDVLAYT